MPLFLHRNHQRFWPVVLLAAALIVALPRPGQSQGSPDKTTVVAVGASCVKGKNVAAAREEAISQGLTAAVETALLKLLPAETLAEHFQKLSALVAVRTDQFVQGFKVLAEATSAKRYRVVVECQLLPAAIEQMLADAGVSADAVTLPKVLYCIAERDFNDTGWRYWWQKTGSRKPAEAAVAAAGVLTGRGFGRVKPPTDIPGILLAAVEDQPLLSDQQAVNLGRQLGAHIVLVGSAVSEKAPSNQGESLKTFKGNVDMRAVSVDGGQAIAATQASRAVASPDEKTGGRDARTQAGETAALNMADLLAAAWQQASASHQPVVIEVSGTRDLPRFIQFRRTLAGIQGVKEMRIDALKPNNAILSLDFDSSADALAEALMVSAVDSFGIQIESVESDRIVLTILPGQP